MSCPMSDAMDSLCQTAPHIILFEPTRSHSRKDLYHQMVANERRILEQSKKRSNIFPHSVTQRASRWCRCLTKTTDAEEHEALVLFELARKNTLAAAYNVNASSKHLEKAKARKMVTPSVETIKVASSWHAEPSMCDAVKVETYKEIAPTRQEVSQEVGKDGTTITVRRALQSMHSSLD